MTTIRCLLVISIAFLLPISLYGEENHSWEFAAAANLYVLPDQTYLNPIISADKSHLHLEARYNYEDLDTGSIFAGYNFRTGDAFELKVTPIMGGVFGNSNGIAPGFLLDLSYRKWSFSSEDEYFFSSDTKESNFFYSWSEIIYSPADWIWFGAAGQRTRAFKTDLEIQRGFLLGFGVRSFAVTGYLMNPGGEDPFGVISLEYTF
ncbi:MAG TPA: hypothetical protein VLR94_04510 [Acidobacteriota bacterium]|nr:hypothetical protein [Acidobacteriota bacterium]